MNTHCIQKQTIPGRYPVWRTDNTLRCGNCAFYVQGAERSDREYGCCALYMNHPHNADRRFYVHPLCRGCLEHVDHVAEYTEG